MIINDEKQTNNNEERNNIIVEEEETLENEPEKQIHLLSLLSVMAIGFIANIEYGIVMPSIWQYIQSLDGGNTYLGWAISSFSISQVIFLPIIGYWADKRTIRESFIISLLIGIIGNIVYATSVHPVMIILGRFLAGIGSSNMALTNSYVTYTSTKAQRTAYMAKINGINAFGLVAGPAFNLGLSKLNFQFHISKAHIIVDPLRSPGWLLTILLILCLISFSFFKEPENKEEESKNTETSPLINNSAGGYSKLPSQPNSKSQSIKSYQNYGSTPYSPEQLINKVNNDLVSNTFKRTFSNQDFNDKKYGSLGSSNFSPNISANYNSRKFKNIINNNNSNINNNDFYNNNSKKENKMNEFFKSLKSLLHSSILTCFLINFVQNLIFGSLETLITPITQFQYDFDSIDNSIMYSIISLIIIIFIVLTIVVSGKGVQDKHVILFGQLFLGAGLILLCLFFGGPADKKVPLWKFSLAVAVTTVGIPTQNTSVYSLYSKLLNRIFGDNAKQSLQSGIMMLVGSFARIIGPLSSYGLELPNRFPLFIAFVSLWLFDVTVTLIFFKSLTFKNYKGSTTIVAH